MTGRKRIFVRIVIAHVDGGVAAEQSPRPLQGDPFVRSLPRQECHRLYTAEDPRARKRARDVVDFSERAAPVARMTIVDRHGIALILDDDSSVRRKPFREVHHPGADAHGGPAFRRGLAAVVAEHGPHGNSGQPLCNVIERPPRDGDGWVTASDLREQPACSDSHTSPSRRWRNRGERAIVVEREERVGGRERTENPSLTFRKNIDRSAHITAFLVVPGRSQYLCRPLPARALRIGFGSPRLGTAGQTEVSSQPRTE